MNFASKTIDISLESVADGLKLSIYPELNDTVRELEMDEADEYGESCFQLLEGHSYEFKLSKANYRLKCPIKGIVKTSRRDKSFGRIIPNIYVGTLVLFVSKEDDEKTEHPVHLEIVATKLNGEVDKSYRENYRLMLESITKKCTELLMQINSPSFQHFEVDFDRDFETIYQRFAFVQSLIGSNEFNEAVQRIISLPATRWTEKIESRDVRKINKPSSFTMRQLAAGNNRIPLPNDHCLITQYQIKDIPNKITSTRKVVTLDTPENRFVKHALELFLTFCKDCEDFFSEKEYNRPQKEAIKLVYNLSKHLSHPFFREISRPTNLKLNSPVLQRKPGYREILNSWLMFALASKLIWEGGNKVYKAGKRDIATLYEYWLFFTLYDLFKEKFFLDRHSHDDKPYDHLIVPTRDGLNIMVKTGKHTALEGVYSTRARELNVKFSYNRTFSGGKKYFEKSSGSWTKALRPDYTLSIWPAGIKEAEAEEKEIIVHMHFDAKYKVNQFIVETQVHPDLTDGEDSLEAEKTEERKGMYKNVDLLKMHAYKDAIRRTGGAYVLYPGTEKQEPLRGFHEIIPGLGAFAMRPSQDNVGIEDLSGFIDKVIDHLLDRASQRENISSKVYNVHKKSKKDDNILKEPMPEYLGSNRLLPDETFVLVGYVKDKDKYDWYTKNKKYNFRMGKDPGSLELTNEVVNAQYLLLRKRGEETASNLLKITSKGPKVYSKEQLIGYPYPKHSFYLVVEIDPRGAFGFEECEYRYKDLAAYKEIQKKHSKWERETGNPFTVTLTELMEVKEK